MRLKLIPPGTRKGYTTYYARGTISGRRVELDTEETTERAAIKAAERIERGLVAAGPLKRGAITFGEAADLYIAQVAPARSEERYVKKLKAQLGKRQASEIRARDLIEVARILYPKAKNETVNRQCISPGAAIIHYAAENDLTDYVRFRRLKERNPEPRAIPSPIADAAIKRARGGLRLLLTWLFRMGTRITETLGARYEAIDWRTSSVRLHVKGDEWITVALHPAVLALLPRKKEGPIFPWRSRGGADKHRRRLCAAIGYRFTFHQCRHTFGTELVNLGENLDHLPNWKDPKSRARYGKPTTERQREIISKLGVKRGRALKAVSNQ